MIISPEARALRKQQQQARIAAKQKAKTPEEYSRFYSSQPMQQARIAYNAKIAEAKQELRDAHAAFDTARASGVGIEEAERAVQAAASKLHTLQATYQRLYRGGGTVALSGGTD